MPHRSESLPRSDMFVRAVMSLLMVPFAASGNCPTLPAPSALARFTRCCALSMIILLTLSLMSGTIMPSARSFRGPWSMWWCRRHLVTRQRIIMSLVAWNDTSHWLPRLVAAVVFRFLMCMTMRGTALRPLLIIALRRCISAALLLLRVLVVRVARSSRVVIMGYSTSWCGPTAAAPMTCAVAPPCYRESERVFGSVA